VSSGSVPPPSPGGLEEPGTAGSRAARLSAGSWSGLGLGMVLALLVVWLVPNAGGADGAGPPVRMLLLTGLLVALATLPGLYLALRHDLALPLLAVVCAVGYNLLLVAVKFALSPQGIYQANRVRPFTNPLWEAPAYGVLAGGAVLLLYVAVYLLLYRLARRHVRHLIASGGPKGRRWAERITLLTAVAILLLALAVPAVVTLIGTVEWLGFVFTSSVAGLVGLALAGAVALAGIAFDSVAKRTRMLGDAGALLTFFWLGLWFLAAYHALWAVYMLVLLAIWPLKVVTAK
jgi:hypothetical protein